MCNSTVYVVYFDCPFWDTSCYGMVMPCKTFTIPQQKVFILYTTLPPTPFAQALLKEY